MIQLAASITACTALSLMLGGCLKNGDQAEAHESKPVICAVNYPLAYFAERIAGDQMKVFLPDIPGDPAFWKLDPQQVGTFQDADLILLNGASYAKWVSQASLPSSRLLDTSARIHDQLILLDSGPSHSHGPGGVHSPGETSFTTWLDLRLAVEQATAIESALNLPESGFTELKADLMALDAQWENAFDQLAGQPVMGSNPAYQYLARRYHLNFQNVHWEPNVDPSPSQWNELTTLIARHPAKFMLWESPPLPGTMTRLRKMGMDSIIFDPCSNRPEAGDFLSVMEQNLANLLTAVPEQQD